MWVDDTPCKSCIFFHQYRKFAASCLALTTTPCTPDARGCIFFKDKRDYKITPTGVEKKGWRDGKR